MDNQIQFSLLPMPAPLGIEGVPSFPDATGNFARLVSADPHAVSGFAELPVTQEVVADVPSRAAIDVVPLDVQPSAVLAGQLQNDWDLDGFTQTADQGATPPRTHLSTDVIEGAAPEAPASADTPVSEGFVDALPGPVAVSAEPVFSLPTKDGPQRGKVENSVLSHGPVTMVPSPARSVVGADETPAPFPNGPLGLASDGAKVGRLQPSTGSQEAQQPITRIQEGARPEPVALPIAAPKHDVVASTATPGDLPRTISMGTQAEAPRLAVPAMPQVPSPPYPVASPNTGERRVQSPSLAQVFVPRADRASVGPRSDLVQADNTKAMPGNFAAPTKSSRSDRSVMQLDRLEAYSKPPPVTVARGSEEVVRALNAGTESALPIGRPAPDATPDARRAGRHGFPSVGMQDAPSGVQPQPSAEPSQLPQAQQPDRSDLGLTSAPRPLGRPDPQLVNASTKNADSLDLVLLPPPDRSPSDGGLAKTAPDMPAPTKQRQVEAKIDMPQRAPSAVSFAHEMKAPTAPGLQAPVLTPQAATPENTEQIHRQISRSPDPVETSTSAPPPQDVRSPLRAPAPATTSLADVTLAQDPDLEVASAVDFAPTKGRETALLPSAPPVPGHGTQSLATVTAQQISTASRDAALDPGAPLDLALDPPELGRVRLSFGEAGGALLLTITAERPETAELMRRHLGLLAEEFGRAGLDAPQVNISQDGDGRRSPPMVAPREQGHAGADVATVQARAAAPSGLNIRPDSGLDIRI